jgi:Ca2+-binding RTX toxin-like protein
MTLATPTNVSASDGLYTNGTEVTWTYPGNISDVFRWDIFRWQPGEAPTFYESAFGSSTSFLDTHDFDNFYDQGAFYYYAVAAYAYSQGRGGISSADLGWTKSTRGTNARDTLIGADSGDKIYGRDGADTLGGNDVLDGGTGKDSLFGGDGKDILIGGSGPSADYLWGEAGADVFRFSQITHSVVGRNRDQIKDFSSGQHDLIDLRGIDANTTAPGNQAFRYIGKAGFSDKAGELRYANHILSGDVDGNGTADFEIRVNAAKLSKYDFML